MAPHSSTLAWKIPWMEEPGGLQSTGRQESDTTERLHFHVSLSCIREGNGNPFQRSCLENPRDGGAWWAAVYRVAWNRTRLKRLSSSSSSSSSRQFLVSQQFNKICQLKEFLAVMLQIIFHLNAKKEVLVSLICFKFSSGNGYYKYHKCRLFGKFSW